MKPTKPAPFAIGGRATTPRPPAPAEDRLRLPRPLHERIKTAVPAVLERTGFPTGEITVTSVPDLSFRMAGDGETWSVTYNAMAGTVGGRRAEDEPRTPISARRFLPRLHLAHGYPPSGSVRWAWALLVDVIAAALVFWSVSGLLMWWQIKATRWPGLLTLVASAAVAGALTVGMYRVLTG